MEINLEQESFMELKKDDSIKNFLPLGADENNEYLLKNKANRRKILKWISKKGLKATSKGLRSRMWGTLGYADGRKKLKGKLQFSNVGNLSSTGPIAEEIEIIKQVYPEIEKRNSKIIEYYVNFDNVDFDLLEGEIPLSKFEEMLPELRLTLFLKRNEGALMYYETFDEGEGTNLEFILPESTNQRKFNRDRLDYYFKIKPTFDLKQLNESDDNDPVVKFDANSLKKSFIVKILKFVRNNSNVTVAEVIKKVEKKILSKKGNYYGLLSYSDETKQFEKFEKPQSEKFDKNGRTLLLIHGTIASIDQSFKGLLQPEINLSWLQRVKQDGVFENIIGFNHPTLGTSPQEDLIQLKKILAKHKIVNIKNVAILTTSRGGLIGRLLLADEDFQNNYLEVSHAAMVACASGVHYFNHSKGGNRFINAIKNLSKILGYSNLHLLILLGQFSFKEIKKCKGLQAMTIGHESLEEILQTDPCKDTTRVKAYTGYWDSKLMGNKVIGFLGRLPYFFTRKVIFKGQHDWVVKTANQAKVTHKPERAEPPFVVRSGHMGYLKPNKTLMLDSLEESNLRKDLIDYFSSINSSNSPIL